MNLLEKFNLKGMPAWKVALLVLAGLLVLAVALTLLKAGLAGLAINRSGQSALDSLSSFAPSPSSFGYGGATKGMEGVALSERNVATVRPDYSSPAGDKAEDFEVTEYYASIETRNLKETCSIVSGLKPLDYVVFESANEYDKGCYYRFKVKRDHREEILEVIKKLNPKDLTENIQSIKKQIDDFTSEEEILKKQLSSVEATLEGAMDDYDKLRALAAQARDVESLAKIIDSKISLIERLSQQRININNQLDRLGRAKAEQLDKVDYIFFSVTISEMKYVDWKTIKDSWQQAVRQAVNDLNRILQAITINLVTVALTIVQFALYLIIALVALKWFWVLARRIWGRSNGAGPAA